MGNPPTRFGVGNVWRWCRNRSENYEFFQAVSHFAHETTTNSQLTEAARKIYQLYVSEAAPLRVDLDDGICQDIKKVPGLLQLLFAEFPYTTSQGVSTRNIAKHRCQGSFLTAF